jgi:hypothetical protein
MANDDARQAALAKVVGLARERPSPAFIIAVPTKRNLEAYENLLGAVLVKELQKNWRASASGAGAVYLYTEHGRKPLPITAPVLVLDAHPELLARVMTDPNATDVVYVPWTKKERDAFKAGQPSAQCIYVAPPDDESV